jgi:serine/tyrosine/threonine adenylyltransferase
MSMNKTFVKLVPQPSFSKNLEADTIAENFTRQVPHAHFSFAATKKPSKPELIHASTDLLHELQLKKLDAVDLDILSGTIPFPNFKPYAMRYGGHQFGHWAGQLGDGRAINILETKINDAPWTFQLKGAGPTPYSRSADGFAVLRSSIREYLCSEAMHNLGVPTTRALSLMKTGDWVPRDMLYNGNRADEHGAVVCRTSPSFVRFGNFEILSAQNELKELKQLLDFTITEHFPYLGKPSKETYLQFFSEVVKRTKDMIVNWQRVGFVHGVMNTDNLSILGLTIDYGPYGWLENYDPSWTPNTTDSENRRYRFGNQPNIAFWNLVQLANAIYPLIEEAKPLEEILEKYKASYSLDYHQMMCSKLGLSTFESVSARFIDALNVNLEASQIDMTMFYRELSNREYLDFKSFFNTLGTTSYLDEKSLLAKKEDWEKWFGDYQKLLEQEGMTVESRLLAMKKVNPKYVLRNYMAQLAIDEADKGNFELVDELYQLLRKPHDEQPNMQKWFALRPDWAMNKVGCSMLSCSS